MKPKGLSFTARLLSSAAAIAIVAAAGAASAEDLALNIRPQPLGDALNEFAVQARYDVVFAPGLVAEKTTKGVTTAPDAETALTQMLEGSGLTFRRSGGAFLIVQGGDAGPQGGGADVDALIVTAQKREENIQDVPIAISAFSQEDLTRAQVAGGPDLMTQVPNMTFTKTNFSGYSIQIRGIGTQAVSATTDPAVAVAFNNTPFVRNRFFEQEFYDLQRIEVLRGPQGTLYGRNATGGVVNILSAKPKFVYEAKLSADLANYNSTRLEGMVNIPLVEDAVALRIAGAWTKHDGFVWNEVNNAPIDGRDLWSTRVSLRVAPSDARFDVNLIWEHFQEDDDRLRSGKQLCKKARPTSLTAPDGTVVPLNLSAGSLGGEAATYSQGCEAVSLYSPDAFQTPNGFAIPYYWGLQGLGLRLRDVDPTTPGAQIADPYLSTTQSRDLRVIESAVDPKYSARSEVFELQANFDLTDTLTLTSETSYSTDELFSLQDLNRFNTTPGIFPNTLYEGQTPAFPGYDIYTPGPNGGGIYCDPQIGCSDRLVSLDLSTANSTQFSQEFRLGSDFDGPFNFSLGANFLRYDTIDKYYVFINTISQSIQSPVGFAPILGDARPSPWIPGVSDRRDCSADAWLPPKTREKLTVPTAGCLYIDPNPIGSLNDQGHNYFLSKNPYKLISYAAFGEIYYNVAENLKITAGLRWTVDKKEAPILPSMLLAADSIGLTVDHVEEQEWREPTGRLTLDWKPDLSFTDETLLYASYAHGYKAGGANPPPTAVITYGNVGGQAALDHFATFPPTFQPEFVDAFELGSKNTLLDGRLTLNTAAFYYDYKNYQISEIVDRAALNRNFDATVWGVELEADWRPIESLKLSFKGGYEKTRVADGEQAIDLMDRTAGDPNWTVIRPFPSTPSNCVIPTWLATWKGKIFRGVDDFGICDRLSNGIDPVTLLPYEANPILHTTNAGAALGPPTSLFEAFGGNPANFWLGYPGVDPTAANNSQGIFKQLGGNELPNAPNWTATVSADYTVPLPNDWVVSLHTDVHWQSASYWRVFNDLEYDRLDEFYVVNLAAIFSNEEAGWNVMAYVKNALDTDALTGAFLFSDDTGLTTNAFLTEPRLYGLRVTKAWSGGSLLGGFGGRHDGPYPFTLELGGQVQRHEAPYASIVPASAALYPAGLDPLAAQHQDLDWGDGREVKLTYNPGTSWKASLTARYGKTNGSASSLVGVQDADYTCGRKYTVGEPACPDPEVSGIFKTDYVSTAIRSKVEHTIVDFRIGADVGLGWIDKASSNVALGVRYAELQSETDAHIFGTPDWILPADQLYKYSPSDLRQNSAQHTEYDTTLVAKREFKGVGPTITWDVSKTLLGNPELGSLTLDAEVTGGALRGKSTTRITGAEVSTYYDAEILTLFALPDVVTSTPVAIQRSKSRTVPVVDLSLGLSYKLDRFSVGAGYRWERYFDAIDGGYATSEKDDRTIDGPYFKLSVGFGG